MLQSHQQIRFEQLVLPHLDAGVNLARWLLRNRADAEDVVQDSMLRACRFFDGFRGGDARAWFLEMVRNGCYSWLDNNRPMELMTEFDEELHLRPSATPASLAVQADEKQQLMQAIELCRHAQREVPVLRELEECSYKEITVIPVIPIGDGDSTLSRARERLLTCPAAVQRRPREL